MSTVLITMSISKRTYTFHNEHLTQKDALYISLIIFGVILIAVTLITAALHPEYIKSYHYWLTVLSEAIILLSLFQFATLWARKMKTLLQVILMNSLTTILIVPLTATTISWIINILFPNFAFTEMLYYNLTNGLLMGIIAGIDGSVVFLQNKALEQEKQIQEREQAINTNKIKALQQQLSPHFLFNSLNTLRGLMRPDNKPAQHYLDELSQVYRYTTQQKEIVELEEEMAFVEAYAYLMQIRHGEGLQIEINVDKAYNHYKVLPISVQLLLENAIKHNRISKKVPLSIRIYNADAFIVVTNPIRPKMSDENASSGIGLENLYQRFMLQLGKPIHIYQDDKTFTVKIPLVP